MSIEHEGAHQPAALIQLGNARRGVTNCNDRPALDCGGPNSRASSRMKSRVICANSAFVAMRPRLAGDAYAGNLSRKAGSSGPLMPIALHRAADLCCRSRSAAFVLILENFSFIVHPKDLWQALPDRRERVTAVGLLGVAGGYPAALRKENPALTVAVE